MIFLPPPPLCQWEITACSFLHKMEAAWHHAWQSQSACSLLVPLRLITAAWMTSTTSRELRASCMDSDTMSRLASWEEWTPLCVCVYVCVCVCVFERRETRWGWICMSLWPYVHVCGWGCAESMDVIVCVCVSACLTKGMCVFERVSWPRSAY